MVFILDFIKLLLKFKKCKKNHVVINRNNMKNSRRNFVKI